MERIEIIVPLPPLETRPNARVFWRRKAEAVKRQRHDACLAAKAALGTRAPTLWVLAEVEATLYRANPKCRRADSDNILAWLKGTFDGLQDAGIVANDCGFIHMPPVQVLGKETGGKNMLCLKVTRREA